MSPPNPPTATSPKLTGGPLHAVKCPWCGKPNDFRGVHSTGLIDKGSEWNCDHCFHVLQVVNMQTHTILTVRQHPTKTGVVSKTVKR